MAGKTREAFIATIAELSKPVPGCALCEPLGYDCALDSDEFKWEFMAIARRVASLAEHDGATDIGAWITANVTLFESIARDHAYRRDNWDGEEVWLSLDAYDEQEDEDDA